MGFRQRLLMWSLTGGARHCVLLAVAVCSAVASVAVGTLGATAIATRIALPLADDRANQRWALALAPLSSVPERYPATETGETALRLEGLAASLGVRLDAGGEAAPATGPAATADPDTFAALVGLLLSGDAPRWAMDVSDCDGAPATSLRGHLRLQRLLLSTARLALDSGRPAEADRLLEASWQLNDPLLRSPGISVHRTACAVIEQEMAVLRSLPLPADSWRVRLAALDLERHALEAYRFEAWRARCRAGRFLADVHPLLRAVGGPLARLLAHQQHEAMLFAVRELPRRDIRSFDPDAFAAEQHARVPRTNPFARRSLPADWTSWPASVRADLDVELALRVLELRDRARAGRSLEPQPRQPSRVPGVDWIYEAGQDAVTITLDSDGWHVMAERPLHATVAWPPSRGPDR